MDTENPKVELESPEKPQNNNNKDEIKNNEEKDDIDGRLVHLGSNNEIAAIDLEDLVIVENKTMNSYAAKKTVAQGMMDIALITANANQMRYVLEYGQSSPSYYFILSLIAISLVLQVCVGLCLIFKGRMDINGEGKKEKAIKLNNIVVVNIFFITIINVLIASFTMKGPTNSSVPIIQAQVV